MTSQDIKQLAVFVVWVLLIFEIGRTGNFSNSLVSIGTMIGTISMAWVSYREFKASHNPVVYIDRFVLRVNRTIKNIEEATFDIGIRNVGNGLATDIDINISTFESVSFSLNKQISPLKSGQGDSVLVPLLNQQKILIREFVEGNKDLIFKLHVKYSGCTENKYSEHMYKKLGTWFHTKDEENVFCLTNSCVDDYRHNTKEFTCVFKEIRGMI